MKKKIRNLFLHRRSNAVFSRETEQEYVSSRLIRYENPLFCSYCAFHDELDLSTLHHKLLERGTTLLLPRIETEAGKRTMAFYEVTADDLRDDTLQKNAYGIQEPDPSRTKKWEWREIWNANPLVIVPGVAFTPDGYRLGYGGGFYDRFLHSRETAASSLSAGDPAPVAHLPGKTIGVGFRVQMTDSIPLDPWDQPLDAVIYYCE